MLLSAGCCTSVLLFKGLDEDEPTLVLIVIVVTSLKRARLIVITNLCVRAPPSGQLP